MKKIELYERAIAEKANSLADYGINRTMFWAYRSSIEAGNDSINFDEVIWDEDIPAIAKAMRENEISEFTISSTFSSLIESLAAFEREGIRMDGLTEVNARYTDWQTGEKKRIPAIRLRVE